MMRREEKRRKFHEALLRTLYPPPSPPSPPPPPPPPEVDDGPFDVTLVDPEEYVKIGSSSRVDGEEEDDGIESETTQKLSRAQRKRLRKMRLKEEAVRRGKLIGPLPPLTETGINDGRGADVQSNSDDSGGSGGGGGDGNGEQSVRWNAQEKEGDKDKMGKVKKRREAKKLAKESSKSIQTHDSIPETRD